MGWPEFKKVCQAVWHFIWEDDSLASWIVNVALAFVLIKFIVYPGLGFLLGTSFPIVAVISGSMEHDGSFDAWWGGQSSWYEERGISKSSFTSYPFKNGFNRGDIIVLRGAPKGKIRQGDVLVFKSSYRPEPIIHRVVGMRDEDGVLLYQTKGDHNPGSWDFEKSVMHDTVVGKAYFRIPLLGYIKIGFVSLLRLLHIPGV